MGKLVLSEPYYQGVDTSSGAETLALTATIGLQQIVSNIGSGGYDLTVTYGSNSVTLYDGGNIWLMYDGTDWRNKDITYNASSISYTPTSPLISSNVQDALDELGSISDDLSDDISDLSDDISDLSETFTINRPSTLDISSVDQTTDLDQYLNGGTNPKPDGWKMLVSWSGGDTTYCHKFTSTHNLKNQFVDKAVGDNSTIYAWCGYGTGGLLLEKDEANSCWRVLTDGIVDRYKNASSPYEWFTMDAGNGLQQGQRLLSNGTLQTLSHLIPFNTVNYCCTGGLVNSTSYTSLVLKYSSLTVGTFDAVVATGTDFGQSDTSDCTMVFCGEGRD